MPSGAFHKNLGLIFIGMFFGWFGAACGNVWPIGCVPFLTLINVIKLRFPDIS